MTEPMAIVILGPEVFEGAATVVSEAVDAVSQGDPEREISRGEVEAWIAANRPDSDPQPISILLDDFEQWQAGREDQ